MDNPLDFGSSYQVDSDSGDFLTCSDGQTHTLSDGYSVSYFSHYSALVYEATKTPWQDVVDYNHIFLRMHYT